MFSSWDMMGQYRLFVLLVIALRSSSKLQQIISHRGACGYVPEHSLVAYELGYEMLTDYDEPDLVLTKDGNEMISDDIFLFNAEMLMILSGVFVAIHDLLLDDVTGIILYLYCNVSDFIFGIYNS